MLPLRALPSRPQQPRRRSTSGFGLIEALIVAAAVSVLTVGVFTFYSSVSAKSKAHETTQAVLQLRQSIHKAYVASANFSGVTNASVLAEQLLPTGLTVTGPASGPEIVAPYGGTILVAAAMVDGIPARGLGLTLNQVPRKLCPQIVASLAIGNFRNITINDSSVLGANGMLQQGLAAQLCAASAESTIALTVADKQTDAALELGTCTAPTPSTQTEVEDCPAGYVGAITKTRSAACQPGSLLAEWGEWNEINTCQPVCAPDPASPQTRTTTPCPEGYLGAITEMRVSACATGQLAGAPSWSDWTETSNTCAPQCVLPADETKVENCPTGQIGQIHSRRSAYCPQPTGSHEWGQWAEVTNTCQLACVVPPSEQTATTRTAANETMDLGCPTGYTGSKIQSRTRTENGLTTVNYSCPSEVGEPVAGQPQTTWLGTYNITSAWVVTTNTCKPICNAPSPTTGTEYGTMNYVRYDCSSAPWVNPKPSTSNILFGFNYTGGPSSSQWTPGARSYRDTWSCPAGSSTAVMTRTYTSNWYATGSTEFTNTCRPYWIEWRKINYCPPKWSLRKNSINRPPMSYEQRRVDGNGTNFDARINVTSYSYGAWTPMPEFDQSNFFGDSNYTCVPCNYASATIDCNGNPR